MFGIFCVFRYIRTDPISPYLKQTDVMWRPFLIAFARGKRPGYFITDIGGVRVFSRIPGNVGVYG